MEAVFLKILQMSATASVVILAVFLLRAILFRAPKKISYALWSVAAFRLCCPWSIRSAVSLFRLAPVRTFTAVSPAAGLPAVVQPAPHFVLPHTAETLPTAPAVVQPAAETPVTVILAILWIVGMAAMLLYGIVCWEKVRRTVETATHLAGNVWQSENVRSPFVFGVFAPKIYLPYRLGEGEREYVLQHERYHIRRGDHIVKLFGFAILAVHWFNPLCWLAFAAMSRDMEMSCDEKILSGTAGLQKAYSTTLLSFASNRRFPAASPIAFGETGVKRRIRNTLQWKKPKTWVTLVAMLLSLALITACAVDPKTASKGGAYESVDAYLDTIYPVGGEIAYNSFEAALSSVKPAMTATAKITDRKVVTKMMEAELENLDPEGVLQSWKYQILVQTDAPADDIFLVGGQYEENGWYDLEGQGGHVLVARCYPDGSIDVLGDLPINDGIDYYGYHNGVRESLYDWYVTQNAEQYPAKEYPRYVIDLRDALPDAYTASNFPLHRVDGDGCYYYVPVSGWQETPINYNLWCLTGEDEEAELPDIRQWRCGDEVAYFTVQRVEGKLDDSDYYGTDGIATDNGVRRTQATFVGDGYFYIVKTECTDCDVAKEVYLQEILALMVQQFTVDARMHAPEPIAVETPFGTTVDVRECENVLGMDAYYTDTLENGFTVRRYRAKTANSGEVAVLLGESFGMTIDDYVTDLDGDGVTELICNCVYGGDGAQRVFVYRMKDGRVERGRMYFTAETVQPTKPEFAFNEWGANASREHYDPENGRFEVDYDIVAGGYMTYGGTLSDFVFEPFNED